MNPWPKQTPPALNAFYGDANQAHDGGPSAAFEAAHITAIAPPYPMYLAWEPTRRVSTIRVNAKCSDSLLRILTAIKDHYGDQDALEAARMHLLGGVYNFRLMRGGNQLSMHSWGCAIDLDPARNAFGSRNWAMPPAVVALFDTEGWTWGGSWQRPDPMHFQAANL